MNRHQDTRPARTGPEERTMKQDLRDGASAPEHECACYVCDDCAAHRRGEMHTVYCPTHAAAHEMLTLLKRIMADGLGVTEGRDTRALLARIAGRA